jgi:hypothetical protein
MKVFQAWIGNQNVRRVTSCVLVAATTFMLTACDHKPQEQSVANQTVDRTRIGESEDMLVGSPPENASAVELTNGDLAKLNQQSKDGLAIASKVLAQEAERVKDYRKAAHFRSLALIQGSLDDHLAMALFFAEYAEQKSPDTDISNLCILWERAIWHADYVIEHAGDGSVKERWANDYREAAKLWRAEFQSKMRALGVEEKCRKSAEIP